MDCEEAPSPGGAVSEDLASLGVKIKDAASVCVAGGAICVESGGTEACDTGAGLPGDTLQQVELWD